MMTWPTKKLGEVAEFQKGKLMPNSAVRTEGVTPYILIDDLRSSNYSHFTPSNQGTACMPSDTLLVWDGANAGTIGGGLTGFVGSTITKVSPVEEIDPEFLRIILSSKFSEFNKQVHGAAIPHLNKDFVYNLPVSVPSMNVQKQIVERMDKIAEAQKLNDELIQKSDELFQSLLHKELNPAGKNWEVRKIKDVASIVNGGTPSTKNPKCWNGKNLWLTPKELSGFEDIEIFDTERKISDEGLNHSSATLLPVGTVLFTSRAPIGYIAIAGVAMATNQGFKNFVCDNKQLNNKFLYFFLRFKKKYLQSLGRGATFTEISKTIVEKIEIPLPPIETQKQIVAKLSAAQEYKTQLLAQKLKLKELFDSVLYKSMKGELSS